MSLVNKLPPAKPILQQLLDHVAKCVTWPMEYPFKSEITRLLGLYQKEENERLVAATRIPARTEADTRRSLSRMQRELDGLIDGVSQDESGSPVGDGKVAGNRPDSVQDQVLTQMMADLYNMRWVKTVTVTEDESNGITGLHIRLQEGQVITLRVGA